MVSSADNEVVLLLCIRASVFTVWLAGPVPRVFLCIIVYLFETNSSTPVLQRDGNKSDSYCEAKKSSGNNVSPRDGGLNISWQNTTAAQCTPQCKRGLILCLCMCARTSVRV